MAVKIPEKIRKQGRRVARASRFSNETIDALIDDLKTQRVPLDRISITDEQQPGLRAIIRKTGEVTLHMQYFVRDSRPSLLLGHYPKMTIAEARELARTVEHLADKGIDVQDGLHDRLIRELKQQGVNWRA